MVYGRRSQSHPSIKSSRVSNYAARGSTARKTKFAANRTPVAKIQRKPFIPRVVKNTQSVYQLSRAVKQLQSRQLGLYQKRTEHVNIAGSILDMDKPICFCPQQFIGKGGTETVYTGCPIWNLTAPAGAGTVWHTALYKNFVQGNLWPNTANECYNPHWASRDDKVSSEVYQPLGTSISFEFSATMYYSDHPTWIRIDVLRPRKMLEKSTQHMLTMHVISCVRSAGEMDTALLRSVTRLIYDVTLITH